jgi:hypothetical protein
VESPVTLAHNALKIRAVIAVKMVIDLASAKNYGRIVPLVMYMRLYGTKHLEIKVEVILQLRTKQQQLRVVKVLKAKVLNVARIHQLLTTRMMMKTMILYALPNKARSRKTWYLRNNT